MTAEKILKLTLEEDGFETKGLSRTVLIAMERYAEDYHEIKVKKLHLAYTDLFEKILVEHIVLSELRDIYRREFRSVS